MSDPRTSSDSNAAPVLFVCEHGVAKSLLAKLLFERHAGAVGLEVKAEARATNPEPELPPWMLENLKATELDPGDFAPRALVDADVTKARHVVCFDLPAVAASAAVRAVKAEQWDAFPPASGDYAATFAAIDARVRVLVEELRRAQGSPPLGDR